MQERTTMESIMEQETKEAATGSNEDDEEDTNDDDDVEEGKDKNLKESGVDTDDSEDTSERESPVAAFGKERKKKYRFDRDDDVLGNVRVVDLNKEKKRRCEEGLAREDISEGEKEEVEKEDEDKCWRWNEGGLLLRG
jgi:hypothetical protein